MPCISGNYNPAVGPLIQVAILDAATAMNPGADGDKNPKLGIFKALIDTGATSTCISGRVVSETGLAPSGKTPNDGRDIICGGSFTLSFDGHFILSI